MSKGGSWLSHRNPLHGWCVLRVNKVGGDKADRYVVPPNKALTEEEANLIAAADDLREACAVMISTLQYRSVPSDRLHPMDDNVLSLMVNALQKAKGRYPTPKES